MTVDVINDSGNPDVATRVRGDLRAGGIFIGTVTGGAGAVQSALEYPADQKDRADRLAAALDAASYLRPAAVPRITLVLGPGDSAPLLRALDRFGAACGATAPTS